MEKKVLVPVADGIEEIEAVCMIDVLRRAGAHVTVASVGAERITASRGVKLTADALISDCMDNTYDLIALPGGMPGAENLRDSKKLITLLKSHIKQGGWYGAVCASPAVVLDHHGLLKGCKATCHPSMTDRLKQAVRLNDRVVRDKQCITSQGPGTALEFALALVAVLYGEEKAREIKEPMLMPS